MSLSLISKVEEEGRGRIERSEPGAGGSFNIRDREWQRTWKWPCPSHFVCEMAAQQDDAVFSIDPSEFVATGEMANSFFDRSAAECQALDEDGDQPSSSPSSGGRIRFHPFIRTVQKIVLYETKSRFYIVGSNSTQDRDALNQFNLRYARRRPCPTLASMQIVAPDSSP